jgi:heptosyltransferase II
MRFQALGDAIITLPYLQSLKRNYPELKIHLLTRKEVSAIPVGISIFDKVLIIGGGRNARIQLLLAILKLPFMWLQGYDAVIDLQKHKISIIIRKLLAANAWAEFDKHSPSSAGERTKKTIEALGLWKIGLDTDFQINEDVNALLKKHGWKKGHSLVALNPAGNFPSREWPIENYITFAKLWLAKMSPDTQFVLLLLPQHKTKAQPIIASLGEECIDMTGKASQLQAFAILKLCSFVISEDSGLMHMAWVQGIPTIALFSSSRKDWSAPQGQWSRCFDSSDLACGPCDMVICKYKDNRCLTRYSPEFILEQAKDLLSLTHKQNLNV